MGCQSSTWLPRRVAALDAAAPASQVHLRGPTSMRLVASSAVLIIMLAVAGVACRRPTSRRAVRGDAARRPRRCRAWLYLQVFDQRPPRGARNGFDAWPRWVPGKFGIPRRVRVAENSVARSVVDGDRPTRWGSSGWGHRRAAPAGRDGDGVLGGLRRRLGHPRRRPLPALRPVGRARRWSAIVTSGSGEPGHLAESRRRWRRRAGAGGAFTYALADLAAHARAQFATPAFQQAMAR